MKNLKLSVLAALIVLLVMVMETPVLAKVNVVSLGFRANQGGSNKLDLGWGSGNMGNTWLEGEWVPYQLVLTKVQESWPNLAGMPDIEISYDFTSSGNRFVDLVRSIQVGTTPLNDSQGWPRDDGTAYPMTTREQIEDAQNDESNASPLVNVWNGFTLLNLPYNQINLSLTGGTGTPIDDRHKFIIKKSDLISAGIPTSANTIVIYYQLHESRTFVWENMMQSGYSYPPVDVWGGYLYGYPQYSMDQRTGSGYVPGSSGHIHLETMSGSKDVPIPVPERPPGDVSGLKWLDINGDGIMNISEPTLPGWRIYVSGTIDGMFFTNSTLTDEYGFYSFPNLTSGTIWRIAEALDSELFPAATGYIETYPYMGDTIGVATAAAHSVQGQAAWGWDVALTNETNSQANVNFGNFLSEPNTVVNISSSEGMIHAGDTVNLTVTETNTGNVPLTNVSVTVGDGITSIPLNQTTAVESITNDDILEVGETWTWTINGVVVNTDTTFIATGYGEDPLGIHVTIPDYPNEQDTVFVDTISPNIHIDKKVDFNGDGIYTDSETNYAGMDAYWRIVVTNTGDCPVYDIYVTDDNGQNYGPFNLLDNGSYEIFNYTTNPTTDLVNEACADGIDKLGGIVGPVCDTAEIMILKPEISIEKVVDFDGDSTYSDSETYYAGADAYWQIVVTNTGNCPVYNIYVSDDNGLNYGPFDLLKGENRIIEYKTNPMTAVVNVACAEGIDELGGTVGPVCDSAEVDILNPEFTIEKKVDFDGDSIYNDSETYYAGAPAHWKIVVTNTGFSPIYDIYVTDDNGLCYGPFNLLNNGQYETINYINNPIEDTLNVACAEGLNELGGAVGPVCDSAEVEVIWPEISIEKTVDFNGDNVYSNWEANYAGSVAHWRIVVTNTGDSPVYDIYVADDNGQAFGPFDLLNKLDNQTFNYTTTPTNDFVNTATAAGIDELDNIVGPVSDPAEVTIIEDSMCYCTFTQGFYGNPGGRGCNGLTTTALINAALTSGGPVVVGAPGRSITFNNAKFILDSLPAGGTAAVLPSGDWNSGNIAKSSLCNKNKPEINNVLVGQVVTLTLNTRLSPDCVAKSGYLAGWILPDVICTVPYRNINACSVKYRIPAPLQGMTVAELLAEANRALAGLATYSGASISQINYAVSAINEAFDQCGMIVPLIRPEICGNGCDDDGDRLIDYYDPDCSL